MEFSEETLKDNLKTVLELNDITTDNVQTVANLQYHTQEQTQKKVKTSKTEMMKKISDQRKQIQAKQQQKCSQNLNKIQNHLLGKK